MKNKIEKTVLLTCSTSNFYNFRSDLCTSIFFLLDFGADHLTFHGFVLVFSSMKIVFLLCMNKLINMVSFFYIPSASSFVSIFSCYLRTRTSARTPGWRFGHDCLIFVRPKPIFLIVDSYSGGQHALALTWYDWFVVGVF